MNHAATAASTAAVAEESLEADNLGTYAGKSIGDTEDGIASKIQKRERFAF